MRKSLLKLSKICVVGLPRLLVSNDRSFSYELYFNNGLFCHNFWGAPILYHTESVYTERFGTDMDSSKSSVQYWVAVLTQ